MDKRAVVIAFVICLDLAFILLMRGSGETVDVLKPIPPPPVQTVNVPLQTEVAETTSDVSPRPIVARKDRDLARIARRSESVHNLPAARRAPSRARRIPAVPDAEFKDTIIWIQPAAYVRDEQANRITSSSREKPQAVLYAKKKRSIFSRTVPIVKKPYQWIKALASKLT